MIEVEVLKFHFKQKLNASLYLYWISRKNVILVFLKGYFC